MNLSRSKMLALCTVAVLAAGGYYMISADAVQGEGELAQAPLNTASQVSPAFIMAVDDSNSMRWQTMFPATNGGACWNSTSKSFFATDGSLLKAGNTCSYYNVMTNPANAQYSSSWYMIPPIDQFGFARSPDFNPAYFDPKIKYLPWVNADGTSFPNASITDTKHDPRETATIKLASQWEGTNNNDMAWSYTSMTLPAGTRYKLSASGTWSTAPANGYSPGNRSIWISYWPATFYLRFNTGSDPYPSMEDDATVYSGLSREKINNACGNGCHLWKYTITATDTAALQNFANWYSYYGNRNRAMVAGMTHAMTDVVNMRVGYFKIGQYSSAVPVMRDMGVATEKALLYTDMLALDATGGTPNLYAVNRIGQQFLTRRGTGAPIINQCQKNAGMLFTDGYSNTGTPSTAAPTDSSVRGVPFDPTQANSMAAIASYYYTTNLGGTAFPAGKVKVPAECATLDPSSIAWKRLDCQTNLHMNFYGITLGASGNLFNPEASTAQDPYTDASVYGNWPGYVADEPSTIDDIWHATVNSRGKYINARTPVEIISAMREILGLVGDGGVPSGSLGLSGVRVGNGSITVTPSYSIANSGTDWYGELVARNVSTSTTTGGLEYGQLWQASQQLPAPADRKIYYGTAGGFNNFNNVSLADLCNNPRSGMSRCTASEITALGVTLSDAVNYLRGERSLENTRLRQRTTVLGDIVNSNAMVSNPASDDYGYRSIAGNTVGSYDPYSYSTYIASKASRPSTVYVGANDGMLHAFDGATGVEKFAYIPQAVLGHMGNLLFPYVATSGSDQKFQHRYYVDGPIAVADAVFGTTASPDWRTVLVGTTGAGGRSVFALNVSDQSLDAGDRLWELNDQHANSLIADNIGHVLGKPVVVPVKDASGTVSWKAIFGNGYGSVDGRAVLFVVDIATGQATLIPAGSDTVNGLGNIIAVDRKAGSTSGRDGYADMVYAVDLKGAVWRFDLSAMTLGTTTTTKLATVTTPVFMATNASGTRQPITGGIEASAASGDNVMLYFGTGSFSFEGDAADNSQQTFYAVLDTGSQVSRSDLLQQSIISEASGARTISSNAMTLANKGWLLDLGTNGERFVGYPQLQNGIVFFTTFEPASTDTCDSNGTNWLYGLYSLNGGAALTELSIDSPTGAKYGTGTGAVDTNTSGVAKEVGVMVSPRMGILAEGATEAEVAAALDAQCTMAILAPGGTTLYMSRPCGRQSWRQLQ